MKNSIAKSSEFESIYQELGNKSYSIFPMMKDVLIFCALVALRKKQERKPFEKKGGDPIKLDIFREDDKNIIDIIALHEAKELSILTDEMKEQKLTIFEEYANAGIAYISQRFNGVPTQSDLRKLIDEFRPEVKYDDKVDLSELIMESLN